LSGNQNRIINEKIKINEINKIMAYSDEDQGEQINTAHECALAFHNVSYKYPGSDAYALLNISFDLRKNEKIVIVGENGSGKSTLLRLILGYDTPKEGCIKIGDVDLKNVISGLRQNTSMMLQNFAKYEMSIKDNIIVSNYDNTISEENFLSFIEWADLDTVISKLKDGYSTDLLGGSILSGGEWQRIALARAVYRSQSRLMMLDEPNASVDPFYERNLYDKFSEMMIDRLGIVVSHRLPICEIADRIIVMHKGQIAEIGSHDELMRMEGSLYKTMFNAQKNLYLGEGL